MRLAVGVLAVAILPSLAAAQSDSHSSSPAAPQASSSMEEKAPSAATPARVLVLDCPTSSSGSATIVGRGEPSVDDTLGTSSLVAALCARATAGASASAERRAEPTVRLQGEAHHEPEAAEPVAPAAAVEPTLRLHLFADIKYSAIDSMGSKNGFALGQFDLFARSQISENLSVLTEATLTALPRNSFNTKLERLLLTFSPNNHVAASIGRFHTGIGYYNGAYHHGTWFQTVVGRPIVFSIDGDIGVIPIHTLGVSVTGEIPSGALGLRYLAEVGSGRAGQSSASIAPQPALSDNNTPSVNLGLFARPDRVDGLQFGVSVYRDRLTLQDTSKSAISETIGAVHTLYKTDVVELLAEALVFQRTPRSAQPATTSRGYYAQASRRFGKVSPYARLDYLDIPKPDQVFGFLGRRSGPTVGVRYDFDALAALKVQTSHLNQTTRATINRFDAQVSFMF